MDPIEREIQIKTKEGEIELLKRQRPALVDSLAAAHEAITDNETKQEDLRRQIIAILKQP